MEDTYNDNGGGLRSLIVKPTNGKPADLRSLIKKKDATESGSTPSNVGTSAPSPSSSNLESPLPKRVSPFIKIAELDDRQNSAIDILAPQNAMGQQNEYFSEQLKKNRKEKILKGDIASITDVVKKEKESIAKSKDQLRTPIAGTVGAVQIDEDEMRVSESERRRLEAYERDLTNDAVEAISTTVTKKFMESPKTDADRKALGNELRRALSQVGADPTYNNDAMRLAFSKTQLSGQKTGGAKNDYLPTDILGGKEGEPSRPGVVIKKQTGLNEDDKKRSVQEIDFKNEHTLLSSVNATLSAKLTELSDNEVVKRYMDGDDQTRAALQDNPAVKQAVEAAQQIRNNIKEINGLAAKYPEVKEQINRQKVIDTFAQQMLLNKRIHSAIPGDYTNGLDLIVGERLDDDDEIQAVAKATGLSEEEVRKHASAASIPSLLGVTLRSAGATVRGAEQYLNRLTMRPEVAGAVNQGIEEDLYRTPEAFKMKSGNYNTTTILHQAADGFGQFLGYALLTKGLGGALGTASRVLGEAVAPLAESGAIAWNTPKLGRALNTASNWLGAESEIVNAGSVLDKVAKAGERARELAGVYASGYASSYESAYREGLEHSDDPAKVESYARDVAFLNGISELILPDIDIAKKALAMTGMKQLLREGKTGLTQGDLVKEFFIRMGDTVGKEVLEEYVPMLGQILDKTRLFNYQTSGNEFLQELWNTTTQTAVSTIPMALLGGGASSSSHFTKSLMFEVGKTPEQYFARIDDLADRGELSEAQVHDRKKMVGTMADIVKVLPSYNNAGEELSEPQRVELSAQIFQQRYNSDLKTKTDKSLHKGYDDKIDQAQAVINRIMNGAEVVQPVAAPQPVQIDVQEIEPEISDEDLAADPTIRALEMLGGLEVAEEPAPVVTTQPTTNNLSDVVLQRNGVTEETIEPNKKYTVIVPNNLGALATMVGAQTIGIGQNNTQVTLTGAQVLDLKQKEISSFKTQQDASLQSQRAQQKSGTESSGQEYVGPVQREQETETQPQPNDSDSVRPGIGQGQAQKEVKLSDVVLQRSGVTQETLEPTRQYTVIVPNHLGALAPLVGGRSRAVGPNYTQVTLTGDQILDLQQRETVPKPRYRVRRADDGTYQLVNEREPEGPRVPIVTVEPPQAAPVKPTAAPAKASPAVKSAYEFGEVQRVPLTRDLQIKGFRNDRQHIEAVKHFRKPANQRPVLLFRHPNGTVFVLDGRAQLTAARANNQKTIAARFFNGTVEQAREFADLSQNIPSRTLSSKRMDRVLANEPQNFEEYVLQAMLQKIRKGFTGGPLFSRKDFERVMGFGGTNNSPLSVGYGQRRGTNDIRDLVVNNIIGGRGNTSGTDFDMFAQSWINNNKEEDEVDLINRMGDIISNFQTKEDIINELERLQGVNEIPLMAQAIPFHITEEEAVYVGEHNLGDLINEITANVTEEDLTEAEANAYRSLLIDNSTPDGNIKVDSMFNELLSTQDPALISLREKLLKNARKEKVRADEPVGDFGGETVFTSEDEGFFYDEETGRFLRPSAEFSRTNNATVGRLTVPQARRVANTLAKAFKGLKVSLDKSAFVNAVRNALSASKEGLSERAIYLMDKLEAARNELKNAQNAFNSKRNQLDRAISQDTQDLFGGRQSEQTAGMFDERVDAKARDAAMQPFKVRLDKAKKAVNDYQTQLNKAMREGPQQLNMFSKSGEVLGVVYNGQVFLNPDAVRADTPMHEIGGHILTTWAYKNQPELYTKIISAAKAAPEEVIADVRKQYPEFEEGSDKFWEEVFATVVGLDGNNVRRAEIIADPTAWQKIRTAINDVWNSFVNLLIDAGVFKPEQTFAPGEFREMTLADFSNMIGERMFQGRRISAPPPLNLRAFADYALLPPSAFLYDNYHNAIDVLPNAKRAIMEEKNSIRARAIRGGTFMRTRNGFFSKLTEDQWLTVRTDNFLQWDGGRAERDANGEPVIIYFQDTPYFTKGNELMPATSNTTFSDEPGDVRFQRIGVLSKLTPIQREALSTAMSMEEGGKTNKDIFLATGWFRDTADKSLRYELPNNNVRFLATVRGTDAYAKFMYANLREWNVMQLENVLDYPELYEAHPEFRSLKVVLVHSDDIQAAGLYDSEKKTLLIAKDQHLTEVYLTLRHEVQHALQQALGFEQGSNLDIAQMYYRRKVGNTRSTLEKLKNNLQKQRQLGADNQHISYLESKANQYETQLSDLSASESMWIEYFYRNYAGEIEARSVEQRAYLSDDIRATLMPELAGRSAITYGDNQLLKPLMKVADTNKSKIRAVYDHQDQNAELIISDKSRWKGDGGNVWRYKFENAGDILRELSKYGNEFLDSGYIYEKVNAIENFIKKFRNDDVNVIDKYSTLAVVNKKVLAELRTAYEEQPIITAAQEQARQLALNLIDGRLGAAQLNIDYFNKFRDGVEDTADIRRNIMAANEGPANEFNSAGQLASDKTVMLENNLNDSWGATCPT